jgi:DNA-binding MarR family transcriptional regulator
MMPSREIDSLPLQELMDVDRLVHEPARLVILTILNLVESADFLFVLNQSGLTRGNLSSHMSKLEQAGYIEVKKEFVDKIPRTLLRITESGRAAYGTYCSSMQRLLES